MKCKELATIEPHDEWWFYQCVGGVPEDTTGVYSEEDVRNLLSHLETIFDNKWYVKHGNTTNGGICANLLLGGVQNTVGNIMRLASNISRLGGLTQLGRHTKVTLGFLYAVARNVVRNYWRKKYRERRRFCRLYEGGKGEMIADGWEIFVQEPDIETKLDTRATLKTLPKRMIEAGAKRAEGEKLNNADKLYLCRQRHRLSKFNWTTDAEIEQMRHLYVDEGLSSVEVAKITGKGRATVQRHLNKLGLIRR